jgi:hypothetical protein
MGNTSSKEPMSKEDHATFLAEEQEGDAGFLSARIAAQLLPPPAPSERSIF